MTESPLLDLRNVRRTFVAGEMRTEALTGVFLKVMRGEYVSIEGPSGSGKSTLLAILGLLDAPTEGQYFLDGRDVTHLAPAERAVLRNGTIGFVFQSFNLIADLTVEENVALPLTHAKVPARQRQQRVDETLNRMGIADRRQHLPWQLSGGQQQRVAVARALVNNPKILLADEPTGSLDSRNADAVMDLLKELHEGGNTICLVTHDRSYARKAQRAVRLFDGRVVEDVRLDGSDVSQVQKVPYAIP